MADNAGPGGGRVFVLRDGKSLNTGVPGIFTYEGYHTVFITLLPSVTKDATENDWVLGRQHAGGIAGSLAEMAKLRRDVLVAVSGRLHAALGHAARQHRAQAVFQHHAGAGRAVFAVGT